LNPPDKILSALSKFGKHILLKPSLYLFIFFIVFSIDRHHRWEFDKHPYPGPFYDDVAQYYSLLPNIFIEHNNTPLRNLETAKVTLGMAFMYSPAFIVGHVMAKVQGEKQDGYSEPYQWTFRWEAIIISILGLWLLRKSLLRFFSETIVAITLTCIFFGTNLFTYTFSLAGMPHNYLFFLFAAFILCSLKWLIDNKTAYLPLLLFIGGIIVFIRPSDIIVFLFPLLFNVNSIKSFFNRILLFFQKPFVLAASIMLFLLPILFQMIIWKRFNGEYVHWSYGKERFFFNDPQITNFLFSYHKGWLLYTPIMVFAVIGIIISAKKLKPFFPFLILFFCLNIYILSCWWDWYYGGSFGCRPLIQSYAFMAFPFAVFVQWVWQLSIWKQFTRYITRTLLITMLFLLIKFNLFQAWQYRWQVIHWIGMNKETYWYVFLRDDLTLDEINYIHSKVTPPKWEDLINGKRD
jgi:hypothetical protein